MEDDGGAAASAVGGERAATLTESELEAWGRRIGAEAALPLVLGLRGELGAGKSVLARSVARGMGVEGAMPSPTYNLIFGYEGRRGEVTHLDLYRLEDPAEVWELGWEDLERSGGMVLIEWPERAESLLPPDRWDIHLRSPDPGAPVREVRARRVGDPPPLPGLP